MRNIWHTVHHCATKMLPVLYRGSLQSWILRNNDTRYCLDRKDNIVLCRYIIVLTIHSVILGYKQYVGKFLRANCLHSNDSSDILRTFRIDLYNEDWQESLNSARIPAAQIMLLVWLSFQIANFPESFRERQKKNTTMDLWQTSISVRWVDKLSRRKH